MTKWHRDTGGAYRLASPVRAAEGRRRNEDPPA